MVAEGLIPCSSCGHGNRLDRRFCTECGSWLARACPACGSAVDSGEKFCGGCGASLSTLARAARAASPAAYTPPHLAEKILTSRAALEGERKQVTVLFADVKGSMELAEQLDPEEWHKIMDGFFQLLAEGVHRFEGTVNQFTGDGIMALFGAPIAHEDHAQRACWAALHLRGELRRYAAEFKRTRGFGFAVRMGLNSGEVVVGRIGDDLRMDYTALGHTVGLAQRMEQLADPGCIYLAENTAALVTGYFQLRDLGRFTLKGSSAALAVHELEGAGALRTRLDVSRTRGFSRFVGRDDEMATLEAALERALAGDGRVVGVVAEPGVGKSRLCYELAQRCRARGIAVYEAQGVAHGKTIPFLPILQIMRAFFGIGEHDGAEEARRKVAGTLVLLDPELTADLPLLFDFLGVSDPEQRPPALDPEIRGRRLLTFVRRLITSRSRREPALVLMEDLHWLDAGSERFVENAVEANAGTRTLFLVNFRPEYHATWTQRASYQQVPLQPLGPEAITALLHDLLGADPSLEELAARIRERTQGNPFFVEEVVQTLAEAGSLAGTKGAYRLARHVDELAIPPTIQAVLAARIDRLLEREKRVLQTAAVIGKEFAEPVLRRVVELAEPDLGAALRALIAAELLYETALYPQAEYAFKHPLTQEVAYRSQLADRRARVHGAVARTIAELDADKLDERAALLAYHWENAGDAMEAARWHARAGEWVRGTVVVEVYRHWNRVRSLLAGVAESADATRLAAQACAELLLVAPPLGMPDEEAAHLFDEGVALAERTEDLRLLALLHASHAAVRGATAGDEHGRVRHARLAVELAVRAGDRRLELGALLPLMVGLLEQGSLDEALAVTDRALAIPVDGPARLWGLEEHAFTRAIRALVFATKGFLSDARRELALGLERARQIGNVPIVTYFGPSWEGYINWLAGDADATLAAARAGIDAVERFRATHGHPGAGYETFAPTSLGQAHLLRGEWSEAVRCLEELRSLCRERRINTIFGEVQNLIWLAEAYLGGGDTGRARALAQEAVAVAERRRPIKDAARAYVVLARALREADGLRARDAIEAALDRATALIEETGARVYTPFVCVERARLAALLGDEAAHERELRAAHRLFTDMGATARAEQMARELSA